MPSPDSIGKEIFQMVLDSKPEESISRNIEKYRHELKLISGRLRRLREQGKGQGHPEYQRLLARKAQIKQLLEDAKGRKKKQMATIQPQPRKEIRKMSTTYELAAMGQVPLTIRMEHTELASPNVGRIVARFNRKPSEKEANKLVAQAFGKQAKPIVGSFREQMASAGCLAFGFVRLGKTRKPLKHAKGMTQIAKNVYMDDTDQSVWQVEGDRIVKTATDDLQEIMSYPDMAPSNPYKPETATMHVAALAENPCLNTRYLCYVDPELAKTSFGAQVSEEKVFDRKTKQLVDIAANLVVDMAQLKGMDRMYEYEQANNLQNAGESDYAAYYGKVYDCHGAYLDKVEETLSARALL